MSLSDHIQYRDYKITFIEPLLGSLPSSKQVYADYIARKAPEPDDEGRKEADMLPDAAQPKTTVFLRDEAGFCCLLDYQFLGFLKAAGNTLKALIEVGHGKKGIKNLRNKLTQFLYVGPRIIHLNRAPDGIFERPLQAMTMRGPRICLASSEVINPDPELSFRVTIGLLPHEEITWGVIEQLLEYGQFSGLGQFRGGGFGRFAFDAAAPAR